MLKNAGATEVLRSNIESIYRKPLLSGRTGALFNAFSYPTKIDPELIALFIATHTDPGDHVLDVFAGSGATGLAAKLCDRPTLRMRNLARELDLEPLWGPRNAVLYELSPLGSLLAAVMTEPPPADEFRRAAETIIATAEQSVGWMYQIDGPDGSVGTLRHAIWSDVVSTPCCAEQITLWDATVDLDPVVFRNSLICPRCDQEVLTADCERLLEEREDRITGEILRQRKRVLARVYGRTGAGTWVRPPLPSDKELVDRIRLLACDGVPTAKIDWGDLYRSGYHSGIDRYHHLYTDRNLRVLRELWHHTSKYRGRLRDALQLLILSYNASHSTLLTRVVAKTNQREPVVTGAQSGVLYVSGLPVEKNIIEGIRRKIRTFVTAFEMTLDSRSVVDVINASSTDLQIDTGTIDYVFTDPPFGDFIPYAEVNELNEAWLGAKTDRRSEVVVSRAQGKDVLAYARLMNQVFAEVRRVMKPDAMATVVFHSSSPSVWQAVIDSFHDNQLEVDRTSILDKVQSSFKQTVSAGGTRDDALFLLRATSGGDLAGTTFTNHAATPGESSRRMYTRYVSECVRSGTPVKFTARDFYRLIESNQGMRIDMLLGT